MVIFHSYVSHYQRLGLLSCSCGPRILHHESQPSIGDDLQVTLYLVEEGGRYLRRATWLELLDIEVSRVSSLENGMKVLLHKLWLRETLEVRHLVVYLAEQHKMHCTSGLHIIRGDCWCDLTTISL